MCSTNAETLLAWSVLFWCGLLLLASRNCLCLAPSHMRFPLLLAHCAALNTDNNFWKLWEHLLPPFSPQGLRFPPSVRNTWKLWKPAKPLPPRWTTRTLWKIDNYFYLCRLTVAMRSSNENLKSTSLTKRKKYSFKFLSSIWGQPRLTQKRTSELSFYPHYTPGPQRHCPCHVTPTTTAICLSSLACASQYSQLCVLHLFPSEEELLIFY